MASSWQPNIYAKPFVPTSAAYVLRLPCCARPVKIKRRGVLGRMLQLVLFSVLIVTVVFNVIFIIDSSKRLRTLQTNNPYPFDDSQELADSNIMLDQKENIEGKIWATMILFFSELCWGKAMVAYTMPQKRRKKKAKS